MPPFTLAGLQADYAAGRRVSEIAAEALMRRDAYSDPAVWIAKASTESVLARAAALDADPDAKKLPLYGVPFAVKDNIDCAGFPTTAGCPEFAYTPADDAPVVARLLAAGAILMGKTNLDQFATGLVGTRSPHGAPRCVFNADYISGGSSSGSAVAVAAGLVAFALGTDTAGSGRVPAAFNNIVGLKPTRGRLSTHGVVPACRSLDCVSIFAATPAEAARIAAVAEGYESTDPYSRKTSAPRALPQHFRFGVLPQHERDFFGDAEYAALYDAAIARLEDLGGDAVAIDYTPFNEAARLLYDGAWVAERTVAIEDFLVNHGTAMDPSVHKIIAGGLNISALRAFQGQYRLAECRRAADREWEKMDILLLPTAAAHYTVEAVAADPIGCNSRLGRFTNWVNLLDATGIAIPSGFRANGLPFGVTLLAPAFQEPALTALAQRYHAAAGTGTGLSRATVTPDFVPPTDDGLIDLFVVGAHLSGMVLNRELQELKAIFGGEARTTADYRFYALAGTVPAKPGLIRQPGADAGAILGEVWRLTPEAFGRFVAKIPAPLGIGKIALADGREVSGFLCEPFALAGARDITALGGWRAHISATKQPSPAK